jgi:transposase
VLREQSVILHRCLLAIVRDDEVCRSLMTTPGVGPVVALTYRATEGDDRLRHGLSSLENSGP